MKSARSFFLGLLLTLFFLPTQVLALDGNGKDEVIVDFGDSLGLWIRLNNSSWFKLHNLSPDSMVTGDMDGT